MSKIKNKRKHNIRNNKTVGDIIENIEVKEVDSSEIIKNSEGNIKNSEGNIKNSEGNVKNSEGNVENIQENEENSKEIIKSEAIEKTVQTDRAGEKVPEENNESSMNVVKQPRVLWNRLLNFIKIHCIRIVGIFALLVFTLLILVVTKELPDTDIVKEPKQTMNSSSIISINMDNTTNTLNYRIERLCIGGTDTVDENAKYTSITDFNWVKRVLDTDTTSYNIDNEEYELPTNLSLSKFIVTRQYGYLEYINEKSNGNKELILSCSKPTNIDTSLLQKVNNRSYENVTPINIKSYVNSFNNSFLMLTESIGGGKLTIDSLLPEIKNIENTAIVSNNTDGILLRFKGLDSISIDKINPELKNDIGVVYNGTTLNVRNIITGEDLIKIGEIDNPEIGCYKEDLFNTTTENVYVSTNDNMIIAIIADDNLYVTKFINKDTMINFGEQLGIDFSNLKINKIQEVIRYRK